MAVDSHRIYQQQQKKRMKPVIKVTLEMILSHFRIIDTILICNKQLLKTVFDAGRKRLKVEMLHHKQ